MFYMACVRHPTQVTSRRSLQTRAKIDLVHKADKPLLVYSGLTVQKPRDLKMLGVKYAHSHSLGFMEGVLSVLQQEGRDTKMTPCIIY